MNSYVYIMTNKTNSTLYIGVTSDLIKRVYEHKNALVDGFTKRYNLKKLVFYEIYDDINNAITREKQLKAWKREWKAELIESQNRDWSDLYDSLV
ncbi:MAG: GIY-YIG nuclease family protein [Sulfurimonas sp.]|uniref:GIY-YIG nuclease family protein n=1 Tax=Sulfurimonas sp. TaxID=2022749 RepID=UPI00261D404A|nr:GIY-YIG nuclease family protein [Sulfurimonas sp.]MDD5372372.1 GIY-YIG nuclease family protein [Sulfurimonas sp.]